MKVCEELWEISAVSGSMGSVAIKAHVSEGHKEEFPICSTKLGSRRMGVNRKDQGRYSMSGLANIPVLFGLTGWLC